MRALVLGGGGAKGAFQAGAFKYLAEKGESFEIISGTSVGSLNGSFLAQYKLGQERQAAEDLVELWKETSTKTVYHKWYYGVLGRLPFFLPTWLGGKTGMYNPAPLRKMLDSKLDVDRILSSGHRLRVSAININTGDLFVWSEADSLVLRQAVLSSSSYPPAFPPVSIGGVDYLDAGAREIIPVEAAIRAGATDITVIACSPYNVVGNLPKKPTGLDIALRTIDASGVEIEKWDLKAVELFNALVESGHPLAAGMSHIKMRIIRPRQALLDDTLDFDPARIRTNIDRGYATASELL